MWFINETAVYGNNPSDINHTLNLEGQIGFVFFVYVLTSVWAVQKIFVRISNVMKKHLLSALALIIMHSTYM